MLQELIMKIMGFERVSFGDTKLYFSKKTDTETKFILKELSHTDPHSFACKSATNPQNYDEPHTLLILTSTGITIKSIRTIDEDFDNIVKGAWGGE